MEKENIADIFFALRNRQDVASMLETSDEQLIKILYVRKTENLYHEILIPKKNGGYRAIDIPDRRLRNLQRKTLRFLENVYKVRQPVYGFVKGKSHIGNAQQHSNQKLVLNIDFKDFFHQIHFGRVMGMLKAKPYELGDQAAMVLAQIACYKGTLPQGAPTSPVISNMVCASCDTKMIRLAQKHKLQYTRYCDDITFSTNKTQFPVAIVKVDKDGNIKIGHELARELKKSGFIVNEDKIHVRDTNKRQEVTGIVVNSFPNLKREYIRELRLILYQCQTKGVYIAAKKYIELKRTKNRHIIDISRKQYKEREKQEWQEKQITDWFLQVLKGKIEYIRCVRGDDCKYYYKYGKIYNVVFGKEIFLINDFDYKKKRWCFVMEGENDKGCVQGTGFLLREYGIVTNEHVITDQSFPFIRVINGEKDTVALITQDSDRLFSNKEIDYAVYAYNVNEGWELGNSDDVREGVTVKILSYPQYVSVDSISEVICKVTGKKKLNLQDPIWCVDKQLFHGSSGGIVLDEENKVIGVVEAGTNAFCLEDDCLSPEPRISGFIPINRIIENYKMRQ